MRTGTESHAAPRMRHAIATLLLAALTFSSGCTSESKIVPLKSDPRSVPELRGRHAAAFESAIQRQRSSPDRSVTRYVPADSELARRLQPLTPAEPAYAAAIQPLEDVLAAVAAPEIAPLGPVAQPGSESDHIDAIAKYLASRQKFEDGKFTDALDDLVAATRLDPLAPEPHRALGDVNMALGRTAAAGRAYRDALSRGLKEPRIFWILGRASLRNSQTDEALRLLKASRDLLLAAPLGERNRTLIAIVESDLAEAVGSKGHLYAMVRLRSSAVDLPPDFSPAPSLRTEFGEIFRRTGEMLIQSGDAMARLGKYDEAAQVYARAEASGVFDPAAAYSRWFTTLLRQGRSGEAAARICEELAARPEQTDAVRLDLLATLGSSEVGDTLRTEIAALADPDAPASLKLLHARTAAATDPAHAATILENAIASNIADPDLLASYFSLWPLTDVNAHIDAARRLIARRPTDASRYADALVAEGLPPERVEAILSVDRTFNGALLNARVLMAWGRWKEAHAAASNLPSPSSPQQSLAGLTATGEAAAIAADWPAAQSSLVQLEAFSTLDARLARVSILRLMQRYSDCIAVLQPALGEDSDGPVKDRSRIDALLRAAEAHVHLLHMDQAESLLRRAVAADPHDDRAYSGLATLLTSASLTNASTKLTDVVRQVRENAPSTRGVRGLIVQQSLSSNPADDGPPLARLRDLIRRMPQDAAMIDQLVQVAEHGRTLGTTYPRSRALIEELATQRPGSAPLNSALAKLLACEGLHEKALATLAALPSQVFDRANLIQQEQLLRDNLKRKDDADRLQARRTEGAAPSINGATETADQLWRDAQFDESVATLAAAVAPGAELDIDQQARVLFLANRALSPISRLTEEPLTGATPEGLRALAFFDIAALHGGRLLPVHHQARLLLVGVNASEDPARLLAAATLAGQQHPTLKLAALRLVTEAAGARVPAKGTEFLFYALEKQPESQKETISALVRRVVTLGTLADVNRVLDLAERPAHVAAILQDLDATPEPGTSDAAMKAELAYIVASGITMSGDATRADAIYRRALAHDPRHGLANNDLGYALLEKGDLTAAEPLIEAAASALPDKPHVLDSLGWLRYRQGRILDNAAGEGALTVLKKALTHSNGDDPAMEEHLGDAMWAAGEYTQAMATWERAQKTGTRRLDELRAFSATREADIKDTREIMKRCEEKRASVLNRKEPAIAPWPGRREPGSPILPQKGK